MPIFVVPMHERTAAPEVKADREFSSTEVRLPNPLRERVLALAATIADEDLHPDEGREDSPHVTVKFGLHTNNAQDVARVVRGVGAVSLRLGPTAIFPAKPGVDYDVVVLQVESPSLVALNRTIASRLPVTDTHPTYRPHVTLAYVKPGRGRKYVGQTTLQGETAALDQIVFSGKDRSETVLPLGA